MNDRSSERPRGWCNTHIALQVFEADELKRYILLDNESTTSIFCNKEYVTSIQDAKSILELHTNGGTLVADKYCDVPLIANLQECWYNEDAVVNILLFHDVQKNYRITFDNESRDVFTLHLSSIQQLEFRPLKNGLYVWKPKKNTTEMSFVNTVEENKSFYTNREIERAKAAREYFHAIGLHRSPIYWL
jgi:hypothetical protein